MPSFFRAFERERTSAVRSTPSWIILSRDGGTKGLSNEATAEEIAAA
jgi:hypothetical protein